MESKEKSIDPTRTILITGFKNTEEYQKYVKNKLPPDQIIEYYTIPKTNFLFAIFYDLRNSIKFYNEFADESLSINYTISKYEISRKQDECTEKNLQSSITFYFKNIEMNIKDNHIINLLKNYGEIRELRNSKPHQKTIVFYDIRSARKAFSSLNDSLFEDGLIKCRWVWDLSSFQRSEYLAKTDELLKSIGGLSKETGSDKPAKKMKIEQPMNNKNILISVFDKLIVANLDDIEKMLKK